jgi:hypothetical protein
MIAASSADGNALSRLKSLTERAESNGHRTLSSAQKASASWCFLAAKARSGLRSASMVKIESESVSLSSSPSAGLELEELKRPPVISSGLPGSKLLNF